MSVTIDSDSLKHCKHEAVLHHMPCNIEYDGEAKIAAFFLPSVREVEAKSGMGDKKKLTSSFRGRPLNGEVQVIPQGFTGYVLKETRKAYSEEEDRKLRVTHTFKEFHNWNLDREPGPGDKLGQALDWIEIANVMHSPITEEEMKSSS